MYIGRSRKQEKTGRKKRQYYKQTIHEHKKNGKHDKRL